MASISGFLSLITYCNRRDKEATLPRRRRRRKRCGK
jgi:hypothetical protein